MSVRTDAAPASLDWRRIAALCSSFIVHVVAAALIAIPLALPLRRDAPKAVEVIFNEIKPPPPPVPPEPRPLPHVKPNRTPQPVAVKPVLQTSSPLATTNTVAVPVATTSIDLTVSGVSGNAPVAGGGESRTLAYAGPLRLKYPPASMHQREQGTVVLRVLVDANGIAQRVEIERSSGHANLDMAAREAVLRAHFRPVLQDGQAVPSWGIVPIEFRLDRA